MLLKAKLLAELPPVSFRALRKQEARPEVRQDLAEYAEVLGAARDAAKRRAAGDMLRRVASVW